MDAAATARLFRLIALTVMAALWFLVHVDITWRVLRSRLIPAPVRILALVPIVAPFLIGRAGYPRMAKSWLAAGLMYGMLWLVPRLFSG